MAGEVRSGDPSTTRVNSCDHACVAPLVIAASADPGQFNPAISCPLLCSAVAPDGGEHGLGRGRLAGEALAVSGHRCAGGWGSRARRRRAGRNLRTWCYHDELAGHTERLFILTEKAK